MLNPHQAAVVAGNEEEIKRIANPRIDIFSADFALLTDIMSGDLNGRTDRKQVTLYQEVKNAEP